MAVSTTTAAYKNGYLVISYGTAAEVLGDLNSTATYTGLEHFDDFISFTQYDATHWSVLYWRNSKN